jgi:serine phosphatase RsbU (regulator of sigma subunit)/PAS domain-containing protein
VSEGREAREAQGRVLARLAEVVLDGLSADLRGSTLTRGLLAAVGEALDAVVVALWVPDPSTEQLRCDDLWTSEPMHRFGSATLGALFPLGVGLPGRVWELQRPVSIDDITTDSNFVRRGAARADGLRGAVGFPVTASGGLVGVIECMYRGDDLPGEHVLPLLGGIGSMIGTLLDRGLADQERTRLLGQVQTERARLNGVLHQLPLGVIVSGPTGDVVLANERVTELLGPPDADGLYRIRPFEGRSFVTGQAAATHGTMLTDHDVEVLSPAGQRIVLSVSSVPVFGSDGTVISAVTTLTDVTERRSRQARSELLAEAGVQLARSLDIDETMSEVARMSVPRLTDLCIVDLLEGSGSRRRVAFAADDENAGRVIRRMHESYGSWMTARVGAHLHDTGEPVSLPVVDDALLRAVARDPDHLALLRELDLRSIVIVPLVGRDEGIGAMTFATTGGREMSQEARDLAVELGRRAGLAVSNAQLYRQARSIADTLQASLVPSRLPEVMGLELGARLVPGGDGMVVGGDFYDVFEVSDGAWAVVIGDVCGKGAEAAALTSRARHSMRAVPERDDPVELLRVVNQLLLSETRASARFCTVVYGVCRVMADGVELRMASAGHPSPYVVRADGRVEAVACRGTMLGVFETVEHGATSVVLRAGDALVLYTDGVTEARSPDGFFGEQGLRAVLADTAGRSADELAAAVCDAVTEYAAAATTDDIAVLVVRAAVAETPA